MRAHRTVRAAISTNGSIISSRTCVSNSRPYCLNTRPHLATGRWRENRRVFSQSSITRAGAAEAVLRQAAANPSALTQEAIIDNLDQVERGRLARIRNIGIAVSRQYSHAILN